MVRSKITIDVFGKNNLVPIRHFIEHVYHRKD